MYSKFRYISCKMCNQVLGSRDDKPSAGLCKNCYKKRQKEDMKRLRNGR